MNSAGVPFQYNLYAEHAVSKILAPVVRSTYQLSSDTQLNVLTFTVNTLITCWTDHILREEIIFRYVTLYTVGQFHNHAQQNDGAEEEAQREMSSFCLRENTDILNESSLEWSWF